MRKIKNDPSTYTKRSDAGALSGSADLRFTPRVSKQREERYLTAMIDERGYIDFRKVEADKLKKLFDMK